MMDFSCGCGGKKVVPKPYPACFKYPIKNLGPGFGAWQTNSTGRWERIKDYEIRNDTMYICLPRYEGGPINGDCPKLLKNIFADTSGLRIVKRSLRMETGPSRYANFLPDSAYGGIDSLSKCTYSCLSRDEQSNFWVCQLPIAKLPKRPAPFAAKKDNMCLEYSCYYVGKAQYKPIKFGKDIQILKIPGKYHISKVGYYVKEADTTFQFAPVGKRKFEAPVMQFPHTIRIESSDRKIYNRSPKTIKFKYNRRTKRKVCTLKQL